MESSSQFIKGKLWKTENKIRQVCENGFRVREVVTCGEGTSTPQRPPYAVPLIKWVKECDFLKYLFFPRKEIKCK